MKKLITLIIMSLLVTSLLGQSADRRNRDRKDLSRHQTFAKPDLENAKSGTSDFRLNRPAVQNTNLHKSTSDVKQSMDSIVMETFIDDSRQWFVFGKTTYTYNSSGFNIGWFTYYWDAENNSWTNGWKVTYAYNSSDEMVQEIEYVWDETPSDSELRCA